MNLREFVNQWFLDPVLSFIAPDLCFLCEQPLPAHHKVVCPQCYQKITPLDPVIIQNLLNEIRPRYFDELYVCFAFDQTFQFLIHLLKYQQYTYIAQLFGRSLAKRLPLNFDCVTAVPLNPVRQKERGYNQSLLIAHELSEITRIPLYEHLLVRTRNTPSQTKLSREERKQNVREAFGLNQKVEGLRILLIDDVITTGSTLNECARILRDGGAAHITIAAMATPTDFFQSDRTDLDDNPLFASLS